RVDGEQRLLVRVDADADDELVVQPVAALDDVEVPVVDRVERAGVHRHARTQVAIRHAFSLHVAARNRSISDSVLYACGLTRTRSARLFTATPAARHRFITSSEASAG